MIRVCVVCEGQTEVEFIKTCLSPYLFASNVSVYPAILQAPSGRHRGGRVTVERLVDFLSHQYYEADRITTLVDFYGFQDAAGLTATQLEQNILAGMQKKMTKGFNASFILPYVQLHEFEALLFSDVEQFSCVLDGWDDRVRNELIEIRQQFATPEDINNHPNTAPSKRIFTAFSPGTYNKTEHGPLIAEAIGITKIRQVCPGFNRWLNKIEEWGNIA
ncbi:DUF4276 family protein [Serratia sp. D1N4]